MLSLPFFFTATGLRIRSDQLSDNFSKIFVKGRDGRDFLGRGATTGRPLLSFHACQSLRENFAARTSKTSNMTAVLISGARCCAAALLLSILVAGATLAQEVRLHYYWTDESFPNCFFLGPTRPTALGLGVATATDVPAPGS